MTDISLSIKDSLDRAVHYFQRVQLANGEFKTIAAKDYHLSDGAIVDSSPFVTSFVLKAFHFYKTDPAIRIFAKKAASYLLSQMESHGIWRYWSTTNDKRYTFPPDLDDTCCVHFALKLWENPVADIRNVIFNNLNDEGLFYTWLVQRKEDIDPHFKTILAGLNSPLAILNLLKTGQFNNIDAAVNANVLMAVGECEESKQAVSFLIDMVLQEKEKEYNTYYPGIFALYYLISRAYYYGVRSFEEIRDIIITKARSFLDTHNDDQLQDTALCINILHNFEERERIPEESIEYLMQKQQPDGNWRGEAFFLGPAPYYGSDELTTAFCFEALARFM